MVQENFESNQYQRNAEMQSESISFIGLCKMVWKHIVLALIVFAVVLAACLAYSGKGETEYQAKTTFNFSVEPPQADDNQYLELNSANNYLNSLLKSAPDTLKSDEVLEPVIEELGLDTTTSGLASQITASNPRNTSYIELLVRDSQAKRSAEIANALTASLSKYIENTISPRKGNKPSVTVNVLQDASVPSSPKNKTKKIMILVGAAAGFVLGILAALLRELCAFKIKKTDDVTEITRMPLLAKVSLGKDPEASYRQAAHTLEYAMPYSQGAGKVIVISAPGKDEDSSAVAASMAEALLSEARSTLLIDGDMDKAKLSSFMNMQGERGLSDVLVGKVDLANAIQVNEDNGMVVLPAGPQPPNASLLIRSQYMSNLLAKVAKEYEYVVINIPSLLASNDLIAIGSEGADVVLAAFADSTRKSDLRSCTTRLVQNGVNVTGYLFICS